MEMGHDLKERQREREKKEEKKKKSVKRRYALDGR
jgi:hypothetical protein